MLSAHRAMLCLLVTLSSSPAAQGVKAPMDWTGPDGEPLRAARFLEDLQPGDTNGGVRLAGDVDGDGDGDLLTTVLQSPALWGPLGLETWIQQGGSFELASVLDFDVGVSPSGHLTLAQHASLSDVTGDGWLDLVYSRYETALPSYWNYVGPSGVLVHPGSGTGSFGASILIDTGGTPWGVVVGDCDGDGDDDVLTGSEVGTTGQYVLTWWSHEAGAFTPSAPLALGNAFPSTLTAIDLGGDGIADALAGVFGPFDVVRIFPTLDGAPTFLGSLSLPSEIRFNGQRFQAGDLDGDGDEDALVVFERTSLPSTFFMQSILQTGSGFELEPLQSFANPHPSLHTRDGKLADWDEDGDADYVSPTFCWMRNDGSGSFAPGAQLYSGVGGSSGYWDLQLTDLDGDGHLDAVCKWSCVRGDGHLPRRPSVPAVGGHITGTPFQDVVLEDMEGDGDLDFFSPGRMASNLLNHGDGTFEQVSGSSVDAFDQLVGWGDFDGDSFRDMVLADFDMFHSGFLGMYFLQGRPDGTYGASPVVPSPVQMTSGDNLSGDLDDDGDVDILVLDGFWENDGTARFGSAPLSAYAGQPLAARDVDEDGDLDLLVRQASTLVLLSNQGGLAFQAQSLGPASTTTRTSLEDADEDGDLDLLVSSPDEGTLWVHEQRPGGFAPPLALPAVGINGRAGRIDANGDGRLDIAAGRARGNAANPTQILSTWIRAEGLSFDERRDHVTKSVLYEEPYFFGDVDSDGDIDASGFYHVENRQYDGPSAGWTIQYGRTIATPGTGGFRPVLGARGPVRLGSLARLVITCGRGGAAGTLRVGTQRTNVLSGGIRVFTQPALVWRSIALDGPSGTGGVGSTVEDLPVSRALFGRTFTYQAVLVDPGASGGLSATNGLEIRFGL